MTKETKEWMSAVEGYLKIDNRKSILLGKGIIKYNE